MPKRREPEPHNRGGIWYMVRRVPKEFEALDTRVLVRISTDIAVVDDPRKVRARPVVRQLNLELESYWRGLRDGKSAEARDRYESARQRAKALGFTYETANEISNGPISDLLRRVNEIVDRKAHDSETEVAAIMGGEERPTLKLSGLVKRYSEIQSASLRLMSANQCRRWFNEKSRAVNNLIDQIGDKEVGMLSDRDGIQYREWWQERIASEAVQIQTANKAFGHISKMLSTVKRVDKIPVRAILAGLRIEGGSYEQREAFAPAFVQDVILTAGALDGLNAQARHLVYLVADTGLRPVEAANLLSEHIILDAPVPHVKVRGVGRVLKIAHTAREIPLVGVALEVMKLNPDGFPKYRDKSSSLSALVNKVLLSRGMRPTKRHTYYSLRHTFEDRLTAIEAPEKIVATLMGHKWQRPKYGAGPSLAQCQRWMQKIAFTPPEHL